MPIDRYLNKIVLNKMTREQFEQIDKNPDEFYAITDKDSELNNPFSLLDYKYSEYELNNLSWLRSNGQYNSKAVHPAVYDLLLKIYNGTETKAGVSVKLSTEEYTDYDFVLNTAEETFRLPIKVKLASGKAVVGNGMTLGLTDGDNNYGLTQVASTGASILEGKTNAFGINIGNSFVSGGTINESAYIGITQDAIKSGIETSDSDLYLYFYVGETVQNANLINAGRIEEKLVDKVDLSNTQWATNACMPDYSAGVSLTNSTYTATYPCLFCCHNYNSTVKVNGSVVGYGGSTVNVQVFLSIGDVVTGATTANGMIYPLKGAK